MQYSQLDDAIVQRGRHPRPDGVEGQALDPSRLGLELGQHGRLWWFVFMTIPLFPDAPLSSDGPDTLFVSVEQVSPAS